MQDEGVKSCEAGSSWMRWGKSLQDEVSQVFHLMSDMT